MSKCDHISWLELVKGEAGPLLAYGSRMSQVIEDLAKPSDQFPQIVFFMGRRLKNHALRQLCGSNYRDQNRHQRTINLRLDNQTFQSAYPRIFADADPTCRSIPPPYVSPRICHQQENFPVQWPETEHAPHDYVISRLLFLFTDVLCIFADDLGGLNGVKEFLLTWIQIGSASNLPSAVRPRVVIVLGGQPKSITQSVLDEDNFLFELLHLSGLPFFTTFSGIQISRLPAEELSPDAQYLQLGGDISSQLRHMRLVRESNRVLFSAKHLNVLFENALQHTTTALLAPYNFILASRQWNPLDGAFISHLVNFVRIGGKSRTTYDDLASYIASAMLMDAYPPGMHMFCPNAVFRYLYRGPCYTAHRQVYSTDALSSFQCNRIEKHFVDLFKRMEKDSEISSQVHCQNIKRQNQFWTGVRSNSTCLTCLRRSPEHPLSCGHSICDTCTEIFGESKPHAEYEYAINQCVPCGRSVSLNVRLKPPTAAPRLLSIDGGGPRGIIPLENLEMLQGFLGLDIPLHDMFDLSVGTSSGGLIVMAFSILLMEICHSKELFKTICKILFSANRKAFIKALISDSTYDSTALEDILKEHFGPDRRMFDTPTSLVSKGKVAVTASSINDGTPFIFTNYNGMAPRRKDPVYGRLRPDIEDEPFLWQVARATSAAPPLFSSVEIPGVGNLQDGGMRRHNNPVNVALSEAKNIWPTIPDPDVVVSLGTGSEAVNRSLKTSNFRNFLVDGWIPRVYRSVMNSFDGQHTSSEVRNILAGRSRMDYFRLDSSFPDAPPAMDNSGSMERLSQWVKAQPSGSWERREIILSLLTTCFFFELDKTPVFHCGLFHCIGTIKCRAPAQSVIHCLNLLQPTEQQEFYKDKLNLGLRLSADDVCNACHRYTRPVRFYARSLEEQLTLSLRLGTSTYRLSAFPNTVQWFIEQQGLDCAFGTANHGIPLKMGCVACSTHATERKKKRKYIDI